MTPFWVFGQSSYEGFFSKEQLPQAPIGEPQNSVFKLRIAPQMHGTAFAISEDILVTNAHNLTQCLRDHNFVESGYDGAKGPLPCRSLFIDPHDTSTPLMVELLGSHSRHQKEGLDFGFIKVNGLKAKPIRLSEFGVLLNEPLWIYGYPGATYRDPKKLEEVLLKLVSLMGSVFEVQSSMLDRELDKMSSEEIFQLWLNKGFLELQSKIINSEFLSGSLLGRSWSPLTSWQNEANSTYAEKIIHHIEDFKKDVYVLINIVEKGLFQISQETGPYQDADGNLKISRAALYRDAEPGVKILRGDATPGSSGSVVVNSEGQAVGILFQIRGLDEDSRSLCALDAIMTDFESLDYKYCSDLAPAVVSSDLILSRAKDWNIKF
jgi:hypothetical protein